MKALLLAAALLAPSIAEAQTYQQSNIAPTDCSGTVTTGGTAVTPIAAGAAAHGFMLANLSTSEVLWWSVTGAAVAGAAGSYALPQATATTFAGFSTFISPSHFGTGGALSVVAATSAHAFSCTRW